MIDLQSSARVRGWIVQWGTGPAWRSGDPTPDRAPRLRLAAGAAAPAPQRREEAGLALVFDGVLYNEDALRSRLAPAHLPPGDVAGLLLHAYRRWSADFLREVRGVFTLFLWDPTCDLLLAARDPLGVYPLFYAQAGADLLFATSVDVLTGAPGVARALNRPVLAEHLCDRWLVPEETHYAAVQRVPPGHWLRIEAGRRQVDRYWHVLPLNRPIPWVREDELDAFPALLEQAVARSLGPGPTGIWLSGGLDSVSVAAVAADLSRRQGMAPPLALSLILPDPRCREDAIQREVAAALGLAQELISIQRAAGPAGVLGGVLEIDRAWPLPVLNPFLAGYRHLGMVAQRAGCGVILTGGGGDEALGVGPIYAADRLRAGDLAGLYRLWANYRRSYPVPRLNLAATILWTYGLRLVAGEAAAGAARRLVPGLYRANRRRRALGLTPAWVARDPALRRTLAARVVHYLPQAETGSSYVRTARQELDYVGVAMDMEENFEFGRRLGVPVRQPFWDADLIAFLYRTPPELLNRGGRAKGLVRAIVATRFPHLGFDRQRKVSASTFFRAVIRRQGGAVWQALGGTPALADLGIVDPVALRSVVTPILDGRQITRAAQFWDIIRLEAWVQTHL